MQLCWDLSQAGQTGEENRKTSKYRLMAWIGPSRVTCGSHPAADLENRECECKRCSWWSLHHLSPQLSSKIWATNGTNHAYICSGWGWAVNCHWL